jgi:hypothetical protein
VKKNILLADVRGHIVHTEFQRGIHAATYEDVRERWGGDPSWTDFKNAAAKGRVRVNKQMALDAIQDAAAPPLAQLLFGKVMPAIWLLSVPLALVLFFTVSAAEWWVILAGFVLAWAAKRAAQRGCTEATIKMAEREEAFYFRGLRMGAFDF